MDGAPAAWPLYATLLAGSIELVVFARELALLRYLYQLKASSPNSTPGRQHATFSRMNRVCVCLMFAITVITLALCVQSATAPVAAPTAGYPRMILVALAATLAALSGVNLVLMTVRIRTQIRVQKILNATAAIAGFAWRGGGAFGDMTIAARGLGAEDQGHLHG